MPDYRHLNTLELSEMPFFTKIIVIVSVATAIGCSVANSSSVATGVADVAPTPAANGDSPAKGLQTAVFAGGCFWGVEAVFEHVKGVTDVRSGYAGGDAKTANYDKVSDGKTAHAESVKVTFDPAKVTYSQLLTVFFSVAHDPTQLNRQGPDTGTHYRSAIFYADEEQRNRTDFEHQRNETDRHGEDRNRAGDDLQPGPTLRGQPGDPEPEG